MLRLHGSEGLALVRHGRFYRTNAQSRVLEEHLVRLNIPYKVVGRHPLLRAARGQGRPRLPAGGGQPHRRGVVAADRQRPQAGGGRHEHRPPGGVGRGPGNGPWSTPWPRPRRPGWGGRALSGHPRPGRAARRAAGRRPGARRRRSRLVLRGHRLPGPSWSRSAPSRPRAGWRTWPSRRASPGLFEEEAEDRGPAGGHLRVPGGA